VHAVFRRAGNAGGQNNPVEKDFELDKTTISHIDLSFLGNGTFNVSLTSQQKIIASSSILRPVAVNSEDSPFEVGYCPSQALSGEALVVLGNSTHVNLAVTNQGVAGDFYIELFNADGEYTGRMKKTLSANSNHVFDRKDLVPDKDSIPCSGLDKLPCEADGDAIFAKVVPVMQHNQDGEDNAKPDLRLAVASYVNAADSIAFIPASTLNLVDNHFSFIQTFLGE
jgi:hypothetical protein